MLPLMKILFPSLTSPNSFRNHSPLLLLLLFIILFSSHLHYILLNPPLPPFPCSPHQLPPLHPHVLPLLPLPMTIPLHLQLTLIDRPHPHLCLPMPFLLLLLLILIKCRLVLRMAITFLLAASTLVPPPTLYLLCLLLITLHFWILTGRWLCVRNMMPSCKTPHGKRGLRQMGFSPQVQLSRHTFHSHGTLSRYKARWVCRGFSQWA